MTSTKPTPCGAVNGRRGRCSAPATRAYVGERVMRGKTYEFVVHRCDRHPLRTAISSTPIGQHELFENSTTRGTDHGHGNS